MPLNFSKAKEGSHFFLESCSQGAASNTLLSPPSVGRAGDAGHIFLAMASWFWKWALSSWLETEFSRVEAAEMLLGDGETYFPRGYFHASQIKLSCLKPALKGVFLMILPVQQNDCVGESS